MRTFHGVEELMAAAGEHLGHSPWHTVTQEQVDTFADATGDHQWIHVDVERAKHGPFGGTIAHGYLTLSLVPMLVWQVYAVEGIAMGVNYGSDKVRYPAPVPVGARVRAGATMESATPFAGGIAMNLAVTMEIEGGSKPAMVATVVYRRYV